MLEQRALLTEMSQVVDLFPGAETSNAFGFQVVNNTAFFHAFDGVTDSLWKTDGTAAGTSKVSTSPDTIQYGDMVNVNGALFFIVRPVGISPFQLWKSDGTDAGTVLVDGSGVLWPFILGSAGSNVFMSSEIPPSVTSFGAATALSREPSCLPT